MSLDLLENVLAWAIGGLLAISALLALIRITIGPSVLDRVVGSDVLVSIVVCSLGAQAALTDGSSTLPLFVYGMLKQRVPPEINAISALMILASIVLVGGSLILQRRGARREA